MRVTSKELLKIVEEETRKHLDELEADEEEDEESEQDRKDRIFPGTKELDRLAHGIAEKRKKKPDCVPGNKWHSKEDGRFTSKDKAGSWAGGYERAGDSSCQAGKWKTKGDGKKLITKHKCGADKEDGVGKHPYKCSTGEKVSESSEDQQAAYIRAIIKQELDSFLDELRASQEQGESHASGCTYRQMLKFIDKFERASKGKLSEPRKT